MNSSLAQIPNRQHEIPRIRRQHARQGRISTTRRRRDPKRAAGLDGARGRREVPGREEPEGNVEEYKQAQEGDGRAEDGEGENDGD